MLSDNDLDILARYVAGDASVEGRPALERWVREDPARERAAAELRRIWESRSHQMDTDAAWLRLEARLDAEPVRATPELTLPRATRRRRLPLRASPFLKAAVLAAVIVGGALTGRALLQERAGDPYAVPQVMREAAVTRPGQVGRLQLPDGTEVVLGVASRLLVDEDYGEKTRIVQIDGDGFFEVAHHPESPFVVRTRTATARALGTEFGVMSRDSGATRVVVSDGRVLVRPTAAEARSQAVVTAGELAQVTSARDPVEVQPADTARLLAWREGRLVFENELLSEVLDELMYWFDGVEFVVTDSALAQRRLNGSFDRPALEDVLQAITISVDATYRRNGRRITLEPEARPDSVQPRAR